MGRKYTHSRKWERTKGNGGLGLGISRLIEYSLTDKELLNQFKIIEKLHEQDKSVVIIFLDAFIIKLMQLAL